MILGDSVTLPAWGARPGLDRRPTSLVAPRSGWQVSRAAARAESTSLINLDLVSFVCASSYHRRWARLRTGPGGGSPRTTSDR
jgi:hypothetical protein